MPEGEPGVTVKLPAEQALVRPRPVLGVLVALAVPTMLALPLLMGVPDSGDNEYGILVAILLVGAIAGFLVARRPDHPVSWLLAGAALAGGVAGLAAFGLPTGTTHLASWQVALAVISGPAWYALLYMVLVLIPLLFPTGSPPSPKWRVAGWVAGLATGVSAVLWALQERFCTHSGASGDCLESVQNPIGIPGLENPETGPFGAFLLGLIFVCATAALVSLVLRFRRSESEERQQIKWVAFSIGLFLLVTVLIDVVWIDVMGRELPPGSWVVQQVLWVMMPASIAVAILRYRLYDIDIVINRTVVFGVLIAFVAAIYGAVVLGLGMLIGGGSKGWSPVLATAIVALTFEPVRHVAQRWANRIAYGHRATPYEVLADLTERLTGAGEGGEILERLAGLVADGTGADQAIVWLGAAGEMRPVASTNDEMPKAALDLEASTVFPVMVDGSPVGALEVVKPRGTSLSTQERGLMADLVGSAGAVFAYRRLNESLILKAREIEMSRSRLVEAEDQERRRLEHQLNEGAQQAILALKMNVGMARRQAADQTSEALVGLLATLEEETQAALEEVRNLAQGIYPPVLESDGLGPAVSALVAGFPVEVQVVRDGLGRYSPEIEAAVYFDISEALTNAVKHAQPPIRIELAHVDGLLRFTVSDSGPGFELATAARGSGLENLQDRVDAVGGRLAITSTPGSGTSVIGEIPVES